MRWDSIKFLQHLQKNTQSAACELDARYRRKLCLLVALEMDSRLRRRESPEDVVQSALMTFFRRNSKGEFQFDHTGALQRLLIRITRRKILKHVEYHNAKCRNPDREVYPDVFEIYRHEPTPLEAAIAIDLIEQVFAGLEASYADVFQLRLEGRTQEEIAKTLGRTRAAVRYKLDRIRDRLKTVLAEPLRHIDGPV